MRHTLINADCIKWMASQKHTWTTIFADPPDNIGTKYSAYDDQLSDRQYIDKLSQWLVGFSQKAQTVWFSYNAKWTFDVGRILSTLIRVCEYGLEAKPCVQIFTFGQHNQYDLGNNHRPLVRIRWKDAPLFPDAIRVESCRQEKGDKRADPRGRVPGDVFDFPRVVGNSTQRRSWHPTQLNEGLVERCIRLTTPPGEPVLDPFAGTGTTLRVCQRTENPCTLIEIDPGYCAKIASEHADTLDWQCGVCGSRIITTSADYDCCENGCGRLIPKV